MAVRLEARRAAGEERKGPERGLLLMCRAVQMMGGRSKSCEICVMTHRVYHLSTARGRGTGAEYPHAVT